MTLSGGQRRVCIVIGASRGIGAAIGAALVAASDWHVVLAARSLDAPANDSLSGSVASVRASILKSHPTAAVDIQACDVRSPEAIAALISSTVKSLARIDAVVYNAGAIWWGSLASTSQKRFDMMLDVNTRGLFATMSNVIAPVFASQGRGTLIVVSPPIYSRFFRGKVAYAAGKVAMSVLAIGTAMEVPPGVAICCLWPATAIESAVTEVQGVDKALMRNADIFADAVVGILNEPAERVNGLTLIDEDYLREFRGITDFAKYRLDPAREPPRMMPAKFPSLLVAEQDDRGAMMPDSSKLSERNPKAKI